MSEFMFGVSKVRVSKKTERRLNNIAKRHGAYLVSCTLPGTGYQRWFCAPNLGHPFDTAVRDAVYQDISRECPEIA